MTQLLRRAMAEVEKLPEAEQDAIAAQILEQVADDRAWDASFARSQNELARIAAKAREDCAAGRVRTLGSNIP
jgi:hypothetical protein